MRKKRPQPAQRFNTLVLVKLSNKEIEAIYGKDVANAIKSGGNAESNTALELYEINKKAKLVTFYIGESK